MGRGSINAMLTLSCDIAVIQDLAGSERSSKARTSGTRFKEGNAINSSLLALGNLVNAMQQNKSHLPWRGSKLTLALNGCLGGHAKSCFVLCVSPELQYASESLSTLQFGAKVRNVQISVRSEKERMATKSHARCPKSSQSNSSKSTPATSQKREPHHLTLLMYGVLCVQISLCMAQVVLLLSC